MTQKIENITNFLSGAKSELKVFFIVWLCLFFIFSPIFFGLSLTPQILAPEAQAWPSAIVTAAKWVWEKVEVIWATVKDWAIAKWEWVKKNISDTIKKALAVALQIAIHQVLAMVTNSIIKWIQSDFQGQPGFITDWEDYLNKAGNAAAGRFLNELAGVNLCSAFSVKIKATMNLPIPSFKTGVECSLDDILNNATTTLDKFKNNFQDGGWLVWQDMSKPNNNAFAVWLATSEEEWARKFNEQQKLGKESKSGFKPTKKCLSNGNTTGGYNKALSACIAGGKSATNCTNDPSVKNKDPNVDSSTLDPNSADCASAVTTAPDGTVEFTTNLAATSTFRGIEASIATLMGKDGSKYAPYVTAIANALITQLVKDGVSGLTGMVSDAVVEEDGSVTSTATTTISSDGTVTSITTEADCLAVSGGTWTWDDPITTTTGTCATTTSSTVVATSADDYEAIMNDYAIIEDLKSNLDQVDTSNPTGTIQSLISSYQSLATTMTNIKNKQLAIIINKWSAGLWENTTNDTDGSETVDDDATATASTTTSTTIESCSGTPTVCTVVATAPATTNMSSYSKTTTITTTDYIITHSRIGEVPIAKIMTEIVDSRTLDPGNYDASGNQLTNYDSTTDLYSLNSSSNLCQSDDASSTILCQIDTDGGDFQSKADALSSIDITSVTATLDNFVNYAEIYDSYFSADPVSSDATTAWTNAETARDSLISSMQTLTGSSSTTLADLNDDLYDFINNTSNGSVTLTSAITYNVATGNMTITASDGTQTTENASTYFQNYYNDLITIYNSL